MGLFFTLVYVGVAYLTPTLVFGSLAEYHMEIILAVLTMVASLVTAGGSRIFGMPQSFALIGLMGSVAVSIVASGWLGGAPLALIIFLPTVMAFFFVVLNCRKKWHVQALVAVMLFTALYSVFQGYLGVRANDPLNLYLIPYKNEAGESFYRIRGLGFINDPNDLAQFLVALLPCTFFFWRKGQLPLNVLFVYLPAVGLVYGMYLTHSRGAMLALLAVALVAGRRKIGVLPALVLGGLMFVGLSASGWSGGRDVSAASGEDRMEAWSTGLGLIRSHPLFGVGYLHFGDYYPITAHNTVVVCAAEIGLVGFFCWMLYAFSTVRDAVVGAATPQTEVEAGTGPEAVPTRRRDALVSRASPEEAAFTRVGAPAIAMDARSGTQPASAALAGGMLRTMPWETAGTEASQLASDVPDAEIRRMLGLMVLSFAGFFTAGWFLSRAYTMGLFINGGIVAVLYRMAQDKGIAPPRLPMARLLRLTGMLCVALIAVVYVILRLDHLLGH